MATMSGPGADGRLPEALSAQGYGLYSGRLRLPAGLLNDSLLITHPDGGLYCLRIRNTDHREGVKAYLDLLHEFMGLAGLGGTCAFRDVAAEVAFVARCIACSLDVPDVITWGAEWMLARYVPGPLLKDYLSAGGNGAVVFSFLDGLLQAHDQGLALMDRWGGNEVVVAPDRVTYLDFDLELRFDGPDAARTAATFDLAVALRTSLLWPSNKDTALGHVLAWCRTLWPWSAGPYDRALLAHLLRAACRFYESSDRPANLAPSAPLAWHTATNVAVARLADWLEYDGDG